jgi:hypothetical protein
MTMPLLAQQRQYFLDHAKRAEEIRLEFSTDACFVCFLDRADQGIPGVVNDHVEPAEMRMGLLTTSLTWS